jgi:hypothetical protein
MNDDGTVYGISVHVGAIPAATKVPVVSVLIGFEIPSISLQFISLVIVADYMYTTRIA